MGTWNNVVLTDLWCALIVAPTLWRAIGDAFERRGAGAIGAAAPAGAIVLLFLCCFPTRLPPSAKQYEWARALDVALQRDVDSNKRVLLPHGVVALLHAGVTETPKDRMVSVLELAKGERTDLSAPTRDRIKNQYYDRIYLYFAWYDFGVLNLIEDHYEMIEELPPSGDPPNLDELLMGSQGIMHYSVKILRPKGSAR
jgi:hypothetical protein